MGNLRAYKYLTAFILPLISLAAMFSHNALVFAPLVFAFVMIPLLEVLFKPDPGNFTDQEANALLNNKLFDFWLYCISALHFIILFIFLNQITTASNSNIFMLIGKITAMGLMCGVVGINVAHELGHRKSHKERLLAKALLLTSLYMHFIIEHNRGHHSRVATSDDPATARFNEPVYIFWIRSIVFSYFSAWSLENERLKKQNKPWCHNEMMWFQFIQASLIMIIYLIFGWLACLTFILAAVMGILLLETVNYIEHYGLMRTKNDKGRYIRTMPWHSWNSDHLLGRMMLFELSRHSDHHYKASKKYQILKHHEDSPQMPTGYPGMMVLALIPPLWFYIMNNRIKWYEHALNLSISGDH